MSIYRVLFIIYLKNFVFLKIIYYYCNMIRDWETFIKLLIVTLLIGFIIILTSCKTNKDVNCDAYGKVNILKIPYTDTIVMESLHYHLDEEQLCCWVPKDTNIYTDTLFLELHYD